MTAGDRIRTARKAAKLTQKELGARLGVTYQTIAQWENNLRNPKQETIQRIADALECDFYWLLWGEKLSEREKIAINTVKLFNFQDKRDQRIVEVTTKRMEYELSGIGYSFSEKEQRIITAFSKMDDEGQEKVADYTEAILPLYRRQEPAQKTVDSTDGKDTPTAQDASEGAEEAE